MRLMRTERTLTNRMWTQETHHPRRTRPHSRIKSNERTPRTTKVNTTKGGEERIHTPPLTGKGDFNDSDPLAQ